MLFASQIVTKVSGSFGGLTGSHNRYGMYFRARSTPVNPNTAAQITVRTAFASLAGDWGALTQLQRDQWDTYAANVPVLNKLGETVNLTGFNMYVRSNVPRLQAGLDAVDDGPTVFALPTVSPVTFAPSPSAGVIGGSLTFDDTEDWTSEDGAALLFFVGREVSPTINFYKGPFTAQEAQLGDSTTPITSPQIIVTAIPGTAGNRVYSAYRLTRADGRLSSQVIIDAIMT